MRIRALLFIPALAAAALAIGVSSASAATIFTTTAHTTRVTVGATAAATSEGPINLVNAAGTVVNSCNHITLHLRVTENTHERSAIDVYNSTFGTCDPAAVDGFHAPPWRLTITGPGFMVGGSQAYPATLHGVDFQLTGSDRFRGNLTTGLTVTQPTTATSPICVDANRAGTAFGVVSGAAGSIDGRFCITSGAAAAWSLT